MFKPWMMAALAVGFTLSAVDAANAGWFGRRGGCSGGSCGVVVSGCASGECAVAAPAAHEGHAATAPATAGAETVAERPADAGSQVEAAGEPSESVYQPVRYRRGGLFRRWR